MSLQQITLVADILRSEREQMVDEVAWLERRHAYLAALKGGILPPIIDTAKIRRVLDISCGPGAWVQAMAMRYPHMQVVGVDGNASAIEQACLRLPANVSNATYLLQDIHTSNQWTFR